MKLVFLHPWKISLLTTYLLILLHSQISSVLSSSVVCNISSLFYKQGKYTPKVSHRSWYRLACIYISFKSYIQFAYHCYWIRLIWFDLLRLSSLALKNLSVNQIYQVRDTIEPHIRVAAYDIWRSYTCSKLLF